MNSTYSLTALFMNWIQQNSLHSLTAYIVTVNLKMVSFLHLKENKT